MANQVSKLNYVDAKLGAPTSGQQTTRYIYDSVCPVSVVQMLPFSKTLPVRPSSKPI
jgi:hypothetical protein